MSSIKLSAKEYVKSKLPGLVSLQRDFRRNLLELRWNWLVLPQLRRLRSVESVFRWHFEQRTWNKADGSVSGRGSNVDVTDDLRRGLLRLLEEYQVKSLLDIPCGDGEWISRAELPPDLSYTGAEIVQELVDMNVRNRGETPNRRFLKLDVTRDDLPRVDLIFCRDCLVHFSNALVVQALRNMKNSGAKFIATTTFPEHQNERDIVTGDWRPISLQSAPFRLPKPTWLIPENSIGPPFADKSIGVWKTADLQI